MDNDQINSLVDPVIKMAVEAGRNILSVYEKTAIDVKTKEDRSPLTLADTRSHNCLMQNLSPLGFPVLSEEGDIPEYENRKSRETFWLVDPLDGTKEFISRNGDFTVNIALIHRQQPVMGVVYVPVSGELFVGAPELGARYVLIEQNDAGQWKAKSKPLQAAGLPRKDGIRVVASRSHMNKETEDAIFQLEKQYGKVHLTSRGSSLKLCMVASGEAHVYPRFAPTMEWDTAAGHAVALHAGLEVVEPLTGVPLRYNKEDLHNPWFIVKSPELRW